MDADTLAEAMGRNAGINYAEHVDAANEALTRCECGTVLRAAYFLSQIGHESVGLRYFLEIDQGFYLRGRSDLGHGPGEGEQWRGRGPLQLTGKSNYRSFGQWCQKQGLTDDPDMFVNQPPLVEQPRWGWLSAAWYWRVARPQLNHLADADDVNGVTLAINGGFNGIEDRRNRLAVCKSLGERILPSRDAGGGKVQTVEKRLDYSRAEIGQDTIYYCGPASCQTLINSRTGEMVPENTLARELGTHPGGTDHIGLLAPVLNNRIGGGYTVVEMPNDPPSGEQRDTLWRHIRGSIDGGYGVPINVVTPPSNYPRASYTSTISPAYSGGIVYHYFAAMGYAVDAAGARHVWIADSGFAPFGYWMTLDQLATCIPPKGYAYPADAWTEPTEGDEFDMATIKDLEATIYKCMKTYLGPNIEDTKDIRAQLTGARDSVPGDPKASYPGWEQLGQNADGDNLTATDAIAALRRDNAELHKLVEKLRSEIRRMK